MKSIKIYILQSPVPYQDKVSVFTSKAKAEKKREWYLGIYGYDAMPRLCIQEVKIRIPKEK